MATAVEMQAIETVDGQTFILVSQNALGEMTAELAAHYRSFRADAVAIVGLVTAARLDEMHIGVLTRRNRIHYFGRAIPFVK